MPEFALREPSPSDWDRWEARLLDGEEPSQAARAESQTCSSFRRQDAARHAYALTLSREIRAGEDREYVRDKLRANVEQAMAADPPRGDVANKALELIGRTVGAFEETTRVELTGTGGGPVQIEDRSASLDDILGVLVSVGATAHWSPTARPKVSSAREVLAAPVDG